MAASGELLPAGSLIIADLHLDPAQAGPVDRFVEWLSGLAGVPRLVILGDLFEYWIGPAQIEENGAVISALRSLAEGGTRVDLIPGNRDFLLDRTFERASGVRLAPGGLLAALPDSKETVLFLHGDELCTLDLAYQRMRWALRSRPVGFLAANLPKGIGRAIAAKLRRHSKQAVAAKPRETTLMQLDEAQKQLGAAGGQLLVCGHAHSFRDEKLPGGGRWLVLDAFGGRRDTLEVGPGGEIRALGSGRA